MNKKRLILPILLLSCLLPLHGQQAKPAWVTQHPVNPFGFAGVGMALVSEVDYQQKAKQHALADLVSEIKIDIAVNSLMHTIDKDGVASVTFAEAIRSSAKAEIEQYRLVDSWQGDGQYWVYYELSRADYDAYMEARRQKAIRDGFDFWYRGHTLLAQGDLNSAVELLLKAMEVIEPVINQELLCSYEEKTINLGMEIYASLTSLFANVTVVLNPSTLSVVPFKGITDPVAIGVYRNGTPLKNIHLTADFLSGEGDLSAPAPTNEAGVSALYIRNITSKQAQQQIRVKMQDAPFAPYLKGAYATFFSKVLATLPEARLTLNLAATPVVAYMHTLPGSLEGLSRSIGSLLTNNFFSVTDTPNGADVTVTTETRIRLGRTVP
ncbi:MAG: LPP20 family lipoprotein, partial [Prevotellaceae bacterium]|nr:LPP20 family lipoprotein [Prevotellaceae bacterium]